MRLHYYQFPKGTPKEIINEYCEDGENTIEGCSITTAKKLLKQYGGIAWTDHIDRDGGLFEVTEIKLKGNNSKFRYNRHL